MRSIRLAVLCLISCLPFFAQNTQQVNQSAGPPPVAVQNIYDFAGGSNLIYIGYALSDQGFENIQFITVSAASNASPVSFTATAHGFDYQSQATTLPSICISGATGGWTGINGCWVATPTSANAFTIPVNSGAFGSFAGQTITVSTRAPLTTASCWAIQKFVYSGSNLIWSGWASNPGGAGAITLTAGSTGTGATTGLAWTGRASYSYQ